MKKLVVCSVALAGTLSLLAKTNYVDSVNGVDEKTRGTSETNAWASLHYAIDKSTAEDTLIVLPGVYSNNCYESNGIRSRFRLAKKLFIESRDGRDSAIVLGEYDPDWQLTGMKGDNYTNGVRCATFGSKAAGSILRGLTFKNGCAKQGGGADATKDVWFVDCAFVDCVGYSGAAVYGGSMARCLIDGCKSGNRVVSSASLWNSVVTRCSGGGTVLAYCREIVGCTLVGNYDANVMRFSTPERTNGSLGSAVYNSIALLNYSNGAGDKCWTNCVTTSTADAKPCDADNSFGVVYGASAIQLVSPLGSDWHLLPGSAAKTAGDGDLLANFSEVAEEFRYTDYYGNAIPKSGTIAAGASQTETAGSYSFIQMDNAGIVDGVEVPVAGGYVACTEPRMVSLKAVRDGKTIFNYQVRANETSLQNRFPQKDGTLSVMAPPAGTTLFVTPTWASKIFYVNQATGSDDDYDGTAETASGGQGPKATIQAAVDVAPSSSYNTIIYVAPGDYKTGGAELYGLQCRVAVTNHCVRLIATGSAAETIIRGAADPDYKDDTTRFGCGPKAVRCYAAYNTQNAIQGFTLTDGHTTAAADGKSDASRRGAAYQTNTQQYSQMLDCIVSNNVGAVGGAIYSGWHLRCRIAENRILQGSDDIVRNCYLASCVFGTNFYGKSCCVGIGNGASMIAWHCTFQGPSPTVAPLFHANCKVYNSIAVDFYHTSQSAVVDGNVFQNFTDVYSSLTSGFTEGDPCFVDKAHGDYRINSLSKAIGAGSAAIENYYKWVTCGIDGEPIQFTDGNPTAGAHQKPLLAVTAVGRGFVPAGVSSVEPGGSLTLQATKKGAVRGYAVNGVTNLTSATSWTVAADDRAYGKDESQTVELLQDPVGMMLIFR